MINSTEQDERAHLERVKQQLYDALAEYEDRLRRNERGIRDQKAYIGENKASMDHAEKAEARQSVNRAVMSAEVLQENARKVRQLLGTPYFGRFDFARQEDGEPTPVYVGIHSFRETSGNASLVYDWRAPISTMFYDYEIGEARYEAPVGEIAGEVTLKRQYRVRNGEMEFMLESGLNIQDDVLQEELSRTSDDKMRNIVATIQRDQNAIIRNEQAQTLVIQGVAGSGKTSIALHRIAFLLYRFKDTLTSRDILIISPNKVFADYISNVLPELGEEQVAETEMETLAHELLDYKIKFQTFFEQASLLAEQQDEALQCRIREKSTRAFLRELDRYIAHIEDTRFAPADIAVGRDTVPADVVGKAFWLHRGLPVNEALKRVSQAVERYLGSECRHEMDGKERSAMKAAVRKMYRKTSLRKTYREFFDWLGKPELFKQARKSTLEYSDVFPLIYLKLRTEGLKHFVRKPKHLLVDEMQDYTTVQYAVLRMLFPCNKTILGDANQSINPFGSSTSEEIQKVFGDAQGVRLCKSYRSSYQITRFAQAISPDADLVAIERHGDEPEIRGFENAKEEIEHIRAMITQAAERAFRTTGVICKTQKQAEKLHHALGGKRSGAHLLNSRSSSFREGTVVCTAHLAKGLEFDQVIVPHVTEKNYATALDRNLLYVACTRAMHCLTVTHVGSKSLLLP